ncbi:MAG: GDSL-type esterase/lipase family protein, partial [Rhodoglobus sp.]
MLVFVGDQVTAGGTWEQWFPERETLTLASTGHGTEELLSRIDELIEAHPTAISLQIGCNDFVQRRSVEHVVRNIEKLLMMLRRDLPGTRMLLQSILPGDLECTADIQDANRHLRQFTPSVKAQYLDLWPAMADESGALLPDLSAGKSTLSERGYEVWLSEMRPALDRLDEAPPM